MRDDPETYDAHALVDMASAGEIEEVRKIVASGISPDSSYDDGTTGLMMAATNNRTESIRVLLELGATVDLRRPYSGDTALQYAVRNGRRSAEAAVILRAAGASEVGIVPLTGKPWQQIWHTRKGLERRADFESVKDLENSWRKHREVMQVPVADEQVHTGGAFDECEVIDTICPIHGGRARLYYTQLYRDGGRGSEVACAINALYVKNRHMTTWVLEELDREEFDFPDFSMHVEFAAEGVGYRK